MDFSLFVFLALPILAVLATIHPPSKKRKRNQRKAKPGEKAHATANDTVLTLLNKAAPDGYFTAANLDAEWNNRPDGSDTTWRQRIVDAVDHWILVKDLQPPTSLTKHEYLRKKFMFSRTHRSMKTGMLACIIYKCVYGPQAAFDRDTNSGGLLKASSGLDVYTNIILPLVKFICHYYNITDDKGGDLLTVDAVLDENYGNWRKNLIERSTAFGVFSAGAVLDLTANYVDNDTPFPDETCCKGIYRPWYKWLVQNFPDFHRDTLAKKPSHIIRDAENTGAQWTTLATDGEYAFA